MNAWESPVGTCAFKIRTGGDWNKFPSYGIDDADNQPTLDGEEVKCIEDTGSSNNIMVSGLSEGTSYKIIFRCTEDGDVFVKVETVTE